MDSIIGKKFQFGSGGSAGSSIQLPESVFDSSAGSDMPSCLQTQYMVQPSSAFAATNSDHSKYAYPSVGYLQPAL